MFRLGAKMSRPFNKTTFQNTGAYVFQSQNLMSKIAPSSLRCIGTHNQTQKSMISKRTNFGRHDEKKPNTFSEKAKKKSLLEASRTLDRLKAIEKGYKQNAKDFVSMNEIKETIKNLRETNGPTKAANISLDILETTERILANSNGKKTRFQLDYATYNLVLSCLAKSRGPKPAQAAEDILDRMIATFRYETTMKKIGRMLSPTIVTFNFVLEAWARSGLSDSGLKAQNVFKKLNDMEVQPSARTYAILMEAWANSGANDAPERANSILQDMIAKVKIHQNEDADKKQTPTFPNTVAFHSVMKAWVNSGRGELAAQKVEDLLFQMEELVPFVATIDEDISVSPNTRTYTFVTQAWSKSGSSQKSVKKVLFYFSRMQNLYHQGLDVKPNKYTFTVVINTLARSKQKGMANQAEALLRQMINMYTDEPDNKDLMPDITIFNVVIDAWSRSGEKVAGEKADGILDLIQEYNEKCQSSPANKIKPDETTINSVITAWVRSKDPRAVERVEKLCSNLMDDAISTYTCNALISVYVKNSNDSNCQKARAVLDRMIKMHENGHPNLKPDALTYSSLMNVYARSSVPNKALHAENIFLEMKKMSEQKDDKELKPDIVTYSILFHACSSTRGDDQEMKQALNIARRNYNQLMVQSENIYPNHVTYRILMELSLNLIFDGEERDKFVEEVFHRCCSDGCLDEDVLTRFQSAASLNLIRKITGKTNYSKSSLLSLNELPKAWSLKAKYYHRQT